MTDARALIVAADGTAPDTLARLLAAAQRIATAIDIVLIGPAPVLPERAAPAIAQRAHGYHVVLAATDDFGRDTLPRAAALTGTALLTDVIALPTPATAVRPMFADSIHATVALPSPVFLTVRPTAFAPAVGGRTPEHVDVPATDPRIRPQARAAAPGGPNLASAPVVLGAGRGAATPARMEVVRRIAARLGAAVGATRPLVDEGLAPPDALLGQSGKVVAPRLYIALGISGALQHLAGVKDAAVIAAINTDAEAPMIEAADLVWIADLDEALPELEKALDGG